jgi:hypothetical protein
MAQDGVQKEAWDDDGRTVQGTISYYKSSTEKPTFHAQDHARDNWEPDIRAVTFHDARTWKTPPRLDREGVCLAPAPTAIKNFEDREELVAKYKGELEEILRSQLGGAKIAKIVGMRGGNMRFSQNTDRYKTGMNSQPAHFPHVDCTMNTATGLVDHPRFGIRKEELKPGQRLVGYNVWRVVSELPQDRPLATCDVRTLAWDDLVVADGVYDTGPEPWARGEAYLVKYNPAHKWIYFGNMRPDEAMVFRMYEDNDRGYPGAAHSAFADPTAPSDAVRISVEARVYAIFDE